MKALLYFEVVTSVALLIGLAVVNLIQPGAGMNVDAGKLDAKAIQAYAAQGQHLSSVDFVMNIIPKTFIGAFSEGEILQVLLLAILVGLALAALGQGKTLIAGCDKVAHLMFGVIGLIMQAAPIGAFGAMAYTVGHYGLKTLIPLAKLMACVYITSIAFVFIVLGTIAAVHGFSVWKFIKYIKEELLIVLGTSSSESVLPRIMVKMEALGCSKSVVGLVIPSGYSFNLDGTSIYLTIAAIFVAQATNTHLTGVAGGLPAAHSDAELQRRRRGHRRRASLPSPRRCRRSGPCRWPGSRCCWAWTASCRRCAPSPTWWATAWPPSWSPNGKASSTKPRMARILNGEEQFEDHSLLAAAASIEPVPFVDQPQVSTRVVVLPD